MNKKRVDDMIPRAYDVLASVKISEKGVINTAFRGQISSFGSSLATGSLIAAVSFFSQSGNAAVDRSKLMLAIHQLIAPQEKTLFDYVKNNNSASTRELVLDCAIALKLAMNLYTLQKEGE